jgi:hypothetical protein
VTRNDALRLNISGADGTAADRYRQALHAFQHYPGDSATTTENPVSRSPDIVMAQVLHAYLRTAALRALPRHVRRPTCWRSLYFSGIAQNNPR